VLETPRARDYVPQQRSSRAAERSVIGPPPRHLAAGVDPRDALVAPKLTPPTRRHGWHWLLVVAGVLPLLTPLYNRTKPAFWGIPFFYWYQIGCAIVTVCIITFIYLITKGKAK
jgi:Protein of unknown function (DUF3311)